MRVYVSGATLVGPGIGDRETGIAVLRGERDYAIADYLPPPPAVLSSTERRRTSPSVRLALHAATIGSCMIERNRLQSNSSSTDKERQL